MNSKPNIVFILVDDLGWGELGCMGHEYNETPNIDELAQNGTLFTKAYASAPVCSPSRAGLLTGQAPPRNRITDYLRPCTDWHLPTGHDNELPVDTEFNMDGVETMAQYLKKKDYKTGIIGKWHLSGYDENGIKHGPANYGFDEVVISEQVGIGGGSYFHPYVHVDASIEKVLCEEEYLVDRMNYEAVEFIKRSTEKPFFLYLSHYAVHTLLDAKKEDIEYFKNKPSNRKCQVDKLEDADEDNPVLAAMLSSVDEGVGMIVDALKALDIYNNTLIVFTSDNGGERNVTTNAHLRGGKSMTYEGGLRVPLVMSWKDRIRQQVCDCPTINLDFYPTFADLIGYDIPAEHGLDGMSILPIVLDSSQDERYKRREFYWHYPLDEPHFLGGRSSVASRIDQYKYIGFFDDSTHELYDLNYDDSEQYDLSAKEPERLKKHYKKTVRWLDEVRGKIPEGQILKSRS